MTHGARNLHAGPRAALDDDQGAKSILGHLVPALGPRFKHGTPEFAYLAERVANEAAGRRQDEAVMLCQDLWE